MPIDVSPAVYSPGLSLKRGPFPLDPVMPAGRGGAGSGSNGFLFASGVFAGAGAGGADEDGDSDWGEAVCAFSAPRLQHKTSAASPASRNAIPRIRFIVSPRTFFSG